MAKKYASKAKAISAVTSVLFAEEGYLEKKSASNLDSKTANAGYNNYTKYWRDLNNWGLMGYGSGWAGGPQWYWCAAFVCWGFIKAFGLDGAKSLLYRLPYILCAQLGADAKMDGMLNNDPAKGDIALFWNGSRFSHTAFIYAVDNTYFYTIEGNTNTSSGVVANGGGVVKKSYNIETYKKKGAKFAHPRYKKYVVKEGAASTSTTETKKDTSTKKTNTINAKVTTKGGNLNCRSLASTDGKLVGQFANGTTVGVKDKTNSKWWKVTGKGTNGKTITGFCSTSYLTQI